MLLGTASVEETASKSPVMDSLAGSSLDLPGVQIFQVLSELGLEARQSLLLPGLHPTNPPYFTWQVWKATDGPLGAFQLAQLRIGCRSGTRPRGYLLGGFIDNQAAGNELTRRFGFNLRPAEVVLDHGYHATSATVTVDGRCILDLAMTDPQPLSGVDIQYSNSLHAARTPMGFRLVQVEPEYTVQHAERGRPAVRIFDAAAWGDASVRSSYLVSASVTTTDLHFPRIRFVCRPDVLAFEGTEAVKEEATAS